MSGSHAEAIASFSAITSVDNATARTYLDATNYNLDEAVGLFFAQGGEGVPSYEIPQTDEEIARRLAQGDDAHMRSSAPSGGLQAFGDDDVRAPIPAKLDRLYGDMPYYPSSRPNGQADQISQHAFRDSEAGSSGRHGVSRHGLRGRQNIESGSGLGAMFELPTDLMFRGGFEAAQQEAQNRNLWLPGRCEECTNEYPCADRFRTASQRFLGGSDPTELDSPYLVNLQSNQEFASHLLNRDTWGDAVLKDIVKGSFIFLQLDITSGEGERFQAYYKTFDLPAIVIVDPVTGRAMKTFAGFVSSERLMEELVSYLDYSPDDPAANKLGTHNKRKSAPKGQSRAVGGHTEVTSENEELERALAMSLQAGQQQPENGEQSKQPQSDSMNAIATASEVDEATQVPPAPEPQAPQKDAGSVQEEARASLPPESEATGEASCRVRVRFPDGSNLTRKFLKSHTVAVLRTFCIASSPEAAGGRNFSLLQAGRGPAVVITDVDQTLEEAGLANSLVSLSWL